MTHHNVSHGMYKTSEYKAWDAMIQRCTNPRDRRYQWYGAKGVVVCEKWRKFAAFIEDMGLKPNPKYSLDREDPNGNYEPNNCRWATRREQDLNRRHHNRITLNGVTKTLKEWSEDTGLPANTINERLRRYGWTVEEALTLSAQKGMKPESKKSRE